MSTKPLKSQRIADKLFYGVIVLLVIALGALGSFFIKRHTQELRTHSQNQVQLTLHYLEQLLPASVDKLNAKRIRETLEKSASNELQAVEIFNEEGERIYVYQRAEKENLQYDRKIVRALFLDEKIIGNVTAYFSINQTIQKRIVEEFLYLILLIATAGLILGMGLYFLAKHIIIRPIHRTLAFSKRLAEGKYNQRIDIRSFDEMGLLQDSLNKMATALEKSITRLQASVKEAREAHQEASEASRLKGEFLANMSHEIRTPLHAIIGFTDLLYEEESSPERRKNLETIQQNAKNLLEHINDILDYSKMETGKLILVKSHFNLPNLINEISQIVRLRLKNKKVTFQTHLAEEVSSDLKGDRTRIRQILLNLLINAVKFTEEGHIGLDVSRNKEGKVLFTITDTGIGIREEDQKRIFNPFMQADASFTKRYGGFGLGLSIVKRLVDFMDGKIGLESRVGEGSTFYFEAPLG